MHHRTVSNRNTTIVVIVAAAAVHALAPHAAAEVAVCSEQEIFASDAEPQDRFGESVAINGQFVIVGAYRDDDACPKQVGCQSGAAYVYNLQGATWNEQQKLVSLDLAEGDQFGYVVGISGDVAIVGANFDDDNGIDSGSAYVFRYDGGQWTQEQKLTAPDGAAGDEFGWGVAVDGSVAIVGAYLDDDNGSNSGSVYVFRFDSKSDEWVFEQKVVALDGQAGDFFGQDVSISGDRFIAGAWRDDDNGTSSGSAYVFAYDGQQWIQEGKLVPSNGAADDRFGGYVSISGDVAISGAPRRNNDTGVAYVFRRSGGSWHQVQQIQASDGQIDDWFGTGVGISGDTLVVHAAFGDPGSAYVFRLIDNTWQEQAILTAADDGLGSGDAAIGGQTVILGTRSDDDMGINAGSAYIFVVQEICCPWDIDGSGAVGITDFLDLLAAWGTDPGGPPDFDGDGNVGIQDFLELLANWGPCL